MTRELLASTRPPAMRITGITGRVTTGLVVNGFCTIAGARIAGEYLDVATGGSLCTPVVVTAAGTSWNLSMPRTPLAPPPPQVLLHVFTPDTAGCSDAQLVPYS